ncbi:alpha/beta hydrolase [Aquimarina sp. AU58]|uniref:alpha/beta hydrolase n=1 Tax=Aquimarina sp. AU58 TaxID=1874112 RepID=UPI000D652BAA|nr:alpha/beta hydrolase-fold protein [Aquimarina sp. AU58]
MTRKALLVILFFSICISANAQLDTIPLTLGKKLLLKSEILNEKIETWLRLPTDFEKHKDSISILVLLDGNEYFKIASDVTELYEWSEKMPPTLIVGLPSTVESRWKYYTPSNVPPRKEINQKDSLLYLNSGKFEKYADFIDKELIQTLSKELKTTFISKTIFGHSNGGLGVMSFYVLRPEIFDNYIAASPAILWDNYYLQKQIGDDNKNKPIYMTIGNNDWDYKHKSFETIREKLEKTNDYFKFIKNSTYGHTNNGLPTLLEGLKYVYETKK